MREQLDTLRRWQVDGAPVALASVIATGASAPQPPGAMLALHPDGSVLGSLSGGCVESAVVEVATQVLATGRPQRLSYGVSDDEALGVGLTCGGTIEVFVRTVTPADLDLSAVADRVAADEALAVVTVVESVRGQLAPGTHVVVTTTSMEGSTGWPWLDAAIVESARGMLAHDRNGLLRLCRPDAPDGEQSTVFVQALVPRPRMLIFGAVDFAAAMATAGRYLGYRVTVCDARARFATSERFPDADEIVVAWPHRYLAGTAVDHRTVICVLTHDPKFDVPVLQLALQSSAAYVGAMGSRATHEERLELLREAGVTAASLSRLRSPIGLDLGGRSPQETAVSIAAEIIACRHGGSGRPLRETAGSIHRAAGSASA